MLSIDNLTVSTEETTILNGLSLAIKPGERVALMGPNGSGKSTLASTLAGHPHYQADGGSIAWNGQDLLAMEPEERSQGGIFLAFQYPATLNGVPLSHFLRLTVQAQRKARGEAPLGTAAFIKEARTALKQLRMPSEFLNRSVGEGFSGGEKKRLEALQMLLLKPKLVILDEIDSGLDIDALKTVAEAVGLLPRTETAVLAITHYQRLLRHLPVDRVAVMDAGRVVREGGPELALELERSGYRHGH